MPTVSLQRYITPLTHVLVWVLFAFSLLLLNPIMGRFVLPTEYWIKQLLLFGLWVGAFYFTAHVTAPRLLLRGRIGWFILALLATAAVITLLSQLIDSWLNLQQLMDVVLRPPGTPANLPPRPRRFDNKGLLTTLLVLGISTSVTAVRKWQQDTLRRQELEQEKVTSELSFLKAQINPHFFFNTLNNIYALTVIDGNGARQAIHTLSRMMRYVLYETPTDTTPLSKELAFVQDYVALMKLRLTDKVAVVVEWPEPLREVSVAPMLLLPFVENAFKHGVSATKPSRIFVAVRQPTPQRLELEVRNTKFDTPTAGFDESNGIGLVNTRRRLDLLYPGRYTLAVTDGTADHEFRVLLTLQDL
ncbi:sensor histidine kinase [Hymenobacter persicinus]|uniref:Sensor histidine kinase n=1 Tax=Hymenobacter persicinus TaxID=2025506 RepID=A0A4Q5LI46_9BACT|nr:histidine kinase [Hymenobacter persicinus]RYU82197.1 sensor histidine kinase [Hymenobacter persicinus]